MPSSAHDSGRISSMALNSVTTLRDEAATAIERSSSPAVNPILTNFPPTNPINLSSKKFHACFFSLSLCIIVAAFDSVVVPTTIPTLTSAFHAGPIVQLVSPVYLLSTTSFQMLYGRFSDIFGRKLSLSVAMFIFMVGNLAAGFSTTLIWLLIFRAIAGAGGGAIISLVQIVVSDMVVTSEARVNCQTIIGSVIAFGYAIGPLISGAFLEKATWRWCFWISTPVSFCAFIAVTAALPSDRIAKETTSILLAIDFVGAILIVCGCASMILPLIWGGVLFSWDSPPVLAPLFCGVLFLVVFCVWEWKGAHRPILPMYIFKHRTVAGVYITTFLYGFIHFSTLYYLPQYLQVIMGYNPIRAGIMFIPFLITTVALSWIGSFIVSRTQPYKNIINFVHVILIMACGLILATGTRYRVVGIIAMMIVAGAGAGQTLQTPLVQVQDSVFKHDMSPVTAFRNFIRCLGGTFTLAVGSNIIEYCLKVVMDDSLALTPSVINAIIKRPSSLTSPTTLGISTSTASFILEHGCAKGFRMIFGLNAVLTFVATLVSILMVRDNDSRTRTRDEKLPDHPTIDSENIDSFVPVDVDKKMVRASGPFNIDVEKASRV